MSFTNWDLPSAGDALRHSLAQALHGNDAFFNAVYSTLQTIAIPNASFDLVDQDGNPVGWTFVNYMGGSLLITTATQGHGPRSARITCPGGASPAGGGYLETEDFIPASSRMAYRLDWELLTTVAAMQNKVEIIFYDLAQSQLGSPHVIHSDSANNPTAVFKHQFGAAQAPGSTRYLKIRLTGGVQGSVAGLAYFDNLVLSGFYPARSLNVFIAGTYRFKAPADAWGALVQLRGPGGNGGAGAAGNDGGSGGGGGGFTSAYVSLVPGAGYTVVIGSPGSANTAFGLTANAGANGTDGAAPGGAGGTATGGSVNTTGSAGSDGSNAGGPGGDGGGCWGSEMVGFGQTAAFGAGGAGGSPGAGGGGGRNGGNAGGAGSAGSLAMLY